MFVIVHSGQTGVERGAHSAALAVGFKVSGFMAANHLDELGRIPSQVSTHLIPTIAAGPRAAIRANLGIADAVMLVVPEADTAERFPAMDWLVQNVRSLRLPMLICDAETNAHQAVSWATRVRGDRSELRLNVTGPRATRWQTGERVARRLVRALAVM
jgi:hypothetical protein